MTESLQVRRRRYVASEISRAAIRLFAERGFDQVTVDEIAEAVGISSRTFARYFASKDDVVLQYQRRLQARLAEALAARPGDEGAITALRNAYVTTSTVAPEDRETVRMQNRFLPKTRALAARAQGERTAAIGPIVELLAGRMGLDPDTDPRPELVATVMASAAGTAFDRWVMGGTLDDPAASVGEAIDQLRRGLGELDLPGEPPAGDEERDPPGRRGA